MSQASTDSPHTPDDKLALTPEEQRASDAIIEVMNAIRDLYGGELPINFTNEGVDAIHRLQHFVMQHWAHRINPYWSDWTKGT